MFKIFDEDYVKSQFNEASADKEAFINKFGQENYDKFLKLKDRLKNRNISVDIVWHTKNTGVDEMNKILDDADKRVVVDDSGEAHMNRVKVFEGEKYIVWHVKDWQTAMNMGDGTVWCITGRYYTDGEVKPSQLKSFLISICACITLYTFSQCLKITTIQRSTAFVRSKILKMPRFSRTMMTRSVMFQALSLSTIKAFHMKLTRDTCLQM